jgi:hypothetical protein
MPLSSSYIIDMDIGESYLPSKSSVFPDRLSPGPGDSESSGSGVVKCGRMSPKSRKYGAYPRGDDPSGSSIDSSVYHTFDTITGDFRRFI